MTLVKTDHPSELWRGYWGIQVLQTGQALGLFEALQTPKTTRELAQNLNLELRYVMLWCQAAASFHLLEETDGLFRLPAHCSDWLLRSKGFTQSHLHLSKRMNETAQAVFGGRALPEPPISLRLLLQENLQSNYQWLFQEMAQKEEKLSQRLQSEARVLEVGCGVGYGLAYLRRFHPQLELFGLELDYECAQEAERSTRAIIHVAELPAQRFATGFDIIICFRTLSASRQPQALLSECASLLKSDGYFLLGSETVDENPDRKSAARIQGERLAYNILAGDAMRNAYSKSELEALLESSGFEITARLEAPDWATPAMLCRKKRGTIIQSENLAEG